MSTPVKLWEPDASAIEHTHIEQFRHWCNARHGLRLDDFASLYEWSINDIAAFWASIWDYTEILHSKSFDEVVDDAFKMPGARWFSGARLNFAENLLRFRDDRVALLSKKENAPAISLTYADLYDRVAALAAAFREMGLKSGDRVAGVVANTSESVIAMLAAASIGALWTSCSPDFGVQGILDRFRQIDPNILVSTDGYRYKGKWIDIREKIQHVCEELSQVDHLVIATYEEGELQEYPIANVYSFDSLVEEHSSATLEFEQLPFDHPLYIMYSSGTTGLPKAIVHGAGGTLIQQLKEHKLHLNLQREDVFFYFSTCGWMMWNWLVSGLASGATLVLYDGNPFYPSADALWQMADDLGITVFGTSAKYLMHCESEGVRPQDNHDLSKLRVILSTGSTLPDESFDYVYRDIASHVHLASISGGTDIISAFVEGSPVLPVYRGELQCRGLGMKVDVFDDDGNSVQDQCGELVCTASAPCMPLYFWGDPDGSAYHDAYFGRYPGVWRQGDYVLLNSATGGMRFFGRSDATLNPGGVRIGTAEVYRAVENMDEIEDSIVVGQRWQNDERVVLFVKMRGEGQLTDEVADALRQGIRNTCSPRHVPAKIVQVSDIPYTLSGKKMELAVRKIIHNEPVRNTSALANPESLTCFRDIDSLTC